MSEELHRKYRPSTLDTVIGQQAIVASITSKLVDKSKMPHAYIFQGPSGCGKCVVGNTLIHTENGISQIQDFSNRTKGFTQKEIEILSKDFIDKTSHFFEEDVSITYKIKNELGQELEGTEEHPILCFTKDCKFEFIKLKDITQENFCCIKRNANYFPKQNVEISYTPYKKINDCNSKEIINIPRYLTEDLGRLLGYITANGSFYKDSIQFSTKNKKIQQDINNILNTFGHNISKIQNEKDFVLGGVHIGRFLCSLIGKEYCTTARFKKVPDCILKGTKAVQINFLRGLFDCDSSLYNNTKVLEYCTASEQLVQEVQIMLLNLGIVSSKKEDYNKKYNHTYYRLLITSRSLDIYFNVITSIKYKIPTQVKRNPNKDIIPFILEKIKKVYTQVRFKLNVDKSGCYLIDEQRKSFIPYKESSAKIGISYESLQSYIKIWEKFYEETKIEEINELILLGKSIINSNFYFSKIIENVKKENKITVYDFSIPKSHCFITNGFISHNTTLSRILAKEVGCTKDNILEIDGATHTGIDDMREITMLLRYTGFGDNPNKFLIIDEAHRLSQNAWDSLLKFIEELPTHLFVALCTTNINKIPETIRQRCHEYTLKEIKEEDLLILLNIVCELESLNFQPNILALIARKAKGSARKSLVLLSKCIGITEVSDVLKMLDEYKEDDALVYDLCKFVATGRGDWNEIKKIIRKVKEEDDNSCESTRIAICNYLNGCILNSSSKEEAIAFMKKVSPFAKPFNPITGLSDLLLCVGDNLV